MTTQPVAFTISASATSTRGPTSTISPSSTRTSPSAKSPRRSSPVKTKPPRSNTLPGTGNLLDQPVVVASPMKPQTTPYQVLSIEEPTTTRKTTAELATAQTPPIPGTPCR